MKNILNASPKIKSVPGLCQICHVTAEIPGNEVKAGEMVEKKAVRFDSVESNRVSYLKALAQTYEVQKKFKEAGEWYGKLLDIKKNFGKTDLYNSGYSFFKGGDFSSSINVFNRYIEKFPQDVFGYYMVGKASAALDSTGALGLAIPHYQKVVEIGEQETDKEKVKTNYLALTSTSSNISTMYKRTRLRLYSL